MLVHVDVHAAADDHVHLDLRYLLLGPDADPAPPPGESQEVAWFAWDAAAAVADEALVGALRSARRLIATGARRGARRDSRGERWLSRTTRCCRCRSTTPNWTSSATGSRRMPERAALAEVRARQAGAGRGDRRGRRPRWTTWPAARRALEERIAASAKRRHELEERMRSGAVTASRDLQAMDHEVGQLAERQRVARGRGAGADGGGGAARRGPRRAPRRSRPRWRPRRRA